MLVSPGELYGDDGAGFVRLAVVQPMVRLATGGHPARGGGRLVRLNGPVGGLRSSGVAS